MVWWLLRERYGRDSRLLGLGNFIFKGRDCGVVVVGGPLFFRVRVCGRYSGRLSVLRSTAGDSAELQIQTGKSSQRLLLVTSHGSVLDGMCEARINADGFVIS